MVRRLVPLILLLACGALCAQERPVELSVGYPSTAIAYVEGDMGALMKTLTDPSLLKGLGVEMELPDLGKLVTESLEIELTDAEVRELLGGIQRGSWGLLDIGVGRPRLKMQIVLRHADTSLLSGALARAQESGAETILSVQEYEGVKIYEIELPAREVQVDPENWGASNPMDDFYAFDTLFVAVHGNKHIIAATGLNYIKDAVDFLSFPDDATDTLAGNKRFKDALAEFDKPDALGFINTTALINTLERVSGDKGNTPLNEVFGGWIRFSVELLEYKQLKSVAAGLWVDQATNTLRVDARVQFHNEPALYTAIKLKPVPQPLTEFVPIDTVSASTYGIEKPRELYTRVMDLLRSRAKESGQQEVLKYLDQFESSVNTPDVVIDGKVVEKGVKIEDILDHLGKAQAWLVLPKSPDQKGRNYMPFETVALFQLNDVKKAEDFFYEKLLKTGFAKEIRAADIDITMIDDVEVHHPPCGPDEDPAAFAFVKDVFMFGNLQGIKRVVAARKSGQTLSTMAAYKQARGMIWNECGSSAYLNVGALVDMFSGGRRMYMFDMPRGGGVTVDATTEDEDPTPYLANFFSGTVLVWGTQARENELALRLCVAGWPSNERFKALAEHFRDVARNKQVRNDFIQILNGATTHFAMKGKAAKEIAEIQKAGYLPKAKTYVDPFSETGEQRAYVLTEVPESVDIRQAVLLAHQQKPGLDGKHLAVLWNGYIVKLTPDELKAAQERAKKGLPLDRFPPLQPLISARGRAVPGEEGPEMMDVEVIDDDGNERVVEAIEGDALDTEKKIDEPVPDDEEE